MRTYCSQLFRRLWNRVAHGVTRRSSGYPLSDVELAIVGAQGKALRLLLTALEARGQIEVEEFASLLGIFAALSKDEDCLEGDILALWAGMLKESL